MESLKGKFRIARKPALFLFLAHCAGLTMLAYGPENWEALRLIGLVSGVFGCGVLFAQHVAIWEADTSLTEEPSASSTPGEANEQNPGRG